MTWAYNMNRERKNAYKTSATNLKGRTGLFSLHTDERIILNWIRES
jgi:hypothetical protein